MIKEFYSNGKLLLSGEYAILDGAEGWAIPTKFGQYLKVTKNDTSKVSWTSLDEQGKVWFEGIFDVEHLNAISYSVEKTAKTLSKILQEARNLNPYFLIDSGGCVVETQLTFPRDWGLGSSSTLINNIALWAAASPYGLLKRTFGGSGYDIACAQHNTPISYQLNKGREVVTPLNRPPSFTDALYFVYLNKKQNSRDGIASYRKENIDKVQLVKDISQITRRMITSSDIKDFEWLISWHEKTISEALGIPTVQEKLFADYFGKAKSLGAWGGDFILATGDTNTPRYFSEKGFSTVIPYKDMVL